MSEIRHYFSYKSNGKSKGTDLNAPLCKRCFKSCVATGGNTSNLAKHLLILTCSNSKTSEIDS